MTQKTDLNITPYYDDYSEDKRFHKILYRAGRPLQARELTQSQSILQDQIEKFGDHFFKEGSIVTGAVQNIDMDVYFIKVQADNPNNESGALDDVESYRTDFHGKYIQGQTTGVVLKVITSVAATSSDKATLICKPYTQGNDSKGSFLVGGDETLKEVTITENTGVITVNTANKSHFKTVSTDLVPSGRASIAEIQEGVVFTRGFFVQTEKQTIILEKYSGIPSYRVGLQIKEELIDSSADTSLQDNAQGTNNENAPGADRLKISLILSKVSLTDTTDVNFIELGRVNNGIIEMEINRPIYSEIEQTFARRTFDTNGDFTVRPFTQTFREHLKTTHNRGFYLATQGGKEDQFVCTISPGKAYVRGFEIDKIGPTNLSIAKARTTQTVDNTATPVRLGNELLVNKIKALPEIADSTNTDAFKPIKIYDRAQNAGAIASGAKHIGFARVRHIENKVNVSTQASDESQLFLFDIQLFTEITYGSHGGTAVVGDKLEGASSGATGIVAYDDNSDGIYLHSVVGTFQSGEAISSRGDGDFSLTTSQNTGVKTFNIGQARSVFQATPGGQSQNFIADVVLDDIKALSGVLSFSSGDDTVTGVGTQFSKELLVGDTILVQGTEFLVDTITSDISMEVKDTDGTAYSGSAHTDIRVLRKRAKLKNQNQSASIFAWPRDLVDTITPTANGVTVRKQEVLTVDTDGNITIPITTSDEKFADASNDTYQFAVIAQSSNGSRTLNVGDVKYADDISSFPSTSDTALVVPIGGNSVDDQAKVLVSYQVIRKNPAVKNKALKEYRSVRYSTGNSAGTAKYGHAFDHKELSLGVSDVHKIHAVLEAVPGSTSGSQSNATPPSFKPALEDPSGTVFVTGEIVVGQTSGARAKLIDYNGHNTKAHFVYLDKNATFSNGESLVGQTNSGIATLSEVSSGSPDIKDRYFLDNGQRDGYYDVSKLQLKQGEPSPNNAVTVIFDHFEPGSGDYFAVNSYSDITYDNIPNYSPNKVDVGGFEPDGQFELSDAVDFRSHINDISTPATGDYNQDSVTDLSGVSTSPFAYESRSFTNKEISCPVPGTTVDATITHYVSRIEKVFLHKSGAFQIVSGTPDISPQRPDPIPEAIELFEMYIPAYTKNLADIKVRIKDHRRFTMKDIGKINQRVSNLERITSLSLLESDMLSKQILDADGFDRFKSGFLVDNFRGHKVGDVTHPDYHVSMDAKNGYLRPEHFTNFFDISFNNAVSSHFVKTGDLITLPFTERTYVDQSKASRSLNVNPYHVFAFIGDIKLSPAVDLWQDTENLPEVRINREGNYDAVLADNQNAIGTVWNAWQTTWVGEPEVVDSDTNTTRDGFWDGEPGQGGRWVENETSVTRDITETPETQTRTGIRTSVVEEFVETRNDRVVSVSVIPFMRSRTVSFTADNLKPNTIHYAFFDGINVDEHVRPASNDYSDDAGSASRTDFLKSNANGQIKGDFLIPNNSQQRFPTGEVQFRLTTSKNNLSNPASAGNATYQAKGTLQTNQTEIISTRNGRVVQETLSGSRQITRRGESINTSTRTETGEPTWEDRQDQPPPDSSEEEVIPPVIDLPPLPNEPEGPIFAPRLDEADLWRGFAPRFTEGWMDPLAQSFLVEANGGMFLSSVDFFFKTKDKALPVNVQVRTMVNGYPGPVILPFSEVTKNPADVNVSQDGATATTFTFDSPVYLEDGKEYCVVLLSNSNEYEAFISRMGESDLITGETISGQPYAGSLFLSQNASTWTAEQTDDLKFHMKVCEFDNSKTGNLQFENDALPSITLQNNPVETFSGETYVKVYNYSHGMYATQSYVTISGVTGDKQSGAVKLGTPSAISGAVTAATYESGSGGATEATVSGGTGSGMKVKVVVDSSDTDAVNSIVITDPGVGFTASDTVTVTLDAGSQNKTFTVGVTTVDDTLGGIPIGAINATHSSLSDYSIDAFNLDLNTVLDGATYSLDSAYGATESTLGGGDAVQSTRDLYYDGVHTMIPSIKPQDCEIFATVRRTGQNSPSDTNLDTRYSKRISNDFIKLNDNAYFSRPSTVASAVNEQNNMGSVKSFQCNLQFRSSNKTVSPVIDVSTIGALAIMNRINNIDNGTVNPVGSGISAGEVYVPSTEPDGDNNVMVYVTRKVTLKNPATSLKVLADNFRPPNTELKFMFKILKNDEETPLDDLGFEFFNSTGVDDANTAVDGKNFKEYEYTADNLPEFSAFVVKIVGQSTNTSSVPLVSALRCLALA